MQNYKATVSKWYGDYQMDGAKQRFYIYNVDFRDCTQAAAMKLASELQLALDMLHGEGIMFVRLMQWTNPIGTEIAI